MTSAKKKPSKSRAKAPARKKAPAKAPAARKKPAKAAAPREEPSPTPAATKRPARSRKRKPSAAAAARPAPVVAGADARSRLGTKWLCFACSAKFYDLQKPEPLCPKCGANQNQRPKRDPKPKLQVAAPVPVQTSRAVERDLLPGDEEEDDGLLMEDEEIDLDGADIDGDGEDFAEEEEEEDLGEG